MTDHPAPPAGVPTCYRHPGRESHIRCQRCERPICPDCMRDAAVGFQCPECIAEGRRTVRSARTTFGGLRPGNPGSVSMVLIGINVAVWLAILASGGSDGRVVDLLALRPNGICNFLINGRPILDQSACGAVGGDWYPGVADGAWWQLLTSAFSHVQLLHIAFNMFALYLFGPQLEAFFGRLRFVALYLVSALSGSALVYWIGPEFSPTLGASGAIYGLMGAFLVISLKVRVNVQGVLTLIGINLLMTVTLNGISWQAHVGGLVGGLLAAAVLVYAPRQHRSAYHVLGLGGIVLISLLSVVLRTAALS